MSVPIAAIDASFFAVESETTRQTIAAYCPLEAAPDLERVRETAKRLSTLLPRLRQRLSVDGELWEDDPSFDPRNHIEAIFDESLRSREDLDRCASKIFSAGLDLRQPLWRLVFVSSESVHGLLYMIHHGFVDGMGALNLLHAFCSDSATALPNDPRPAKEVVESDGIGFKKWRSLFRLLQESITPVTPSAVNGRNSGVRQISTLELPLSELRHLKTTLGGSLNDLLLTLVSSALRATHLREHKPLLDLRVIMPVSLRRPAALFALGNHLTGVGIRLPLGIASPTGRLRAVKEYVDRIKRDGSFGAYALLGRLQSRLPAWLQARLCNAAARRNHFICTNMSGPRKEQFIGGARILGEYGAPALLRDQGIAFSFISYADKLCLSIVSDPQVVRDPQQLINDTLEGFHELQALVPTSDAAQRIA